MKGEVTIEVCVNTSWVFASWLAGASRRELDAAIREVRSRFPSYPIRYLRGGKYTMVG